MGKVLIACEESQAVCKAFRAKGYEAYSCDIQAPSGGHPEWHILGDALAVLKGGQVTTMDGQKHDIGQWDLLIAHPPCTYLSNLGANHLYLGTEKNVRRKDVFRLMNEDRIRNAILARDFFLAFLDAPIAKIAVENPVPSTLWCLPEKTQAIQPYMFGNPYKKKTYLWLKGLPVLSATNVVEPTGLWVDGGHAKETKMQTFGFRSAKKRSKTFPGIAEAMADQWGKLL